MIKKSKIVPLLFNLMAKIESLDECMSDNDFLQLHIQKRIPKRYSEEWGDKPVPEHIAIDAETYRITLFIERYDR